MALLVLCETTKALVLLPTFRPFLYAAPHPPYDSLMASGALYSLVAAYMVQGRGVNGRYAARALAVASVRCAERTVRTIAAAQRSSALLFGVRYRHRFVVISECLEFYYKQRYCWNWLIIMHCFCVG